MGWVDRVFGLFGDVTGRIRDFIWSLIQSFIAWVQAGFDWLASSVGDLGRWASAVVGNLGDAITNLGRWAWDNIAHYYNEAVSFTQRAVGDLGSWASGTIRNLSDWVGGLFATLRDFANSIPQWVIDHIYRPLNDAINYALSWVENSVIPWVSKLVDSAFGTLRSYVDALRGWAEGAMRTILDPIWPYIDLVRKSWDWLLYFATHPFTAIHDLITEALGVRSGDLINSIIAAFLQRGDEAEQIVARWIFGMVAILGMPFVFVLALRSRLLRIARRR